MTSPATQALPYGCEETFHLRTRWPSNANESGASPTPFSRVNGHRAVHQPSCMIPDDPNVASYDHLPSNTHAFARRLEKFARLCADVPAASTRTSPEARVLSISTRAGPTRPLDAESSKSASSESFIFTTELGSESRVTSCMSALCFVGVITRVASREETASSASSFAPSGLSSSAPPRTASTRVQSSRVIEPAPWEGTSRSPSAWTSTPRTRHTCRLSAEMSVATGSAEPLAASPCAVDISA
mmetsp:Transcript_8032/g.34169  ORF Transcript_8032/g.34169 Transcript_8032/m.34169 type:complete len:243 (-) Transcript_8032:147-875(-)